MCLYFQKGFCQRVNNESQVHSNKNSLFSQRCAGGELCSSKVKQLFFQRLIVVSNIAGRILWCHYLMMNHNLWKIIKCYSYYAIPNCFVKPLFIGYKHVAYQETRKLKMWFVISSPFHDCFFLKLKHSTGKDKVHF